MKNIVQLLLQNLLKGLESYNNNYYSRLKWFLGIVHSGLDFPQKEEISLLMKDWRKNVEKLPENNFGYKYFLLGLSYELGIGVELDINEAINSYKRAAEKSNSHAMAFLGDIYQEENNTQALEWYKKSAELGNDEAMFALGTFHQYEKIDINQALEWYKKSAELGNCEAMRKISDLYKEEWQEIEHSVVWKIKQYAIDDRKYNKNSLINLIKGNPSYHGYAARYLCLFITDSTNIFNQIESKDAMFNYYKALSKKEKKYIYQATLTKYPELLIEFIEFKSEHYPDSFNEVLEVFIYIFEQNIDKSLLTNRFILKFLHFLQEKHINELGAINFGNLILNAYMATYLKDEEYGNIMRVLADKIELLIPYLPNKTEFLDIKNHLSSIISINHYGSEKSLIKLNKSGVFSRSDWLFINNVSRNKSLAESEIEHIFSEYFNKRPQNNHKNISINRTQLLSKVAPVMYKAEKKPRFFIKSCNKETSTTKPEVFNTKKKTSKWTGSFFQARKSPNSCLDDKVPYFDDDSSRLSLEIRMAAYKGDVKKVSALLEKRVNIDEAVSGAASGGRKDLVFKLLEAGACIELATSVASRSGQIALVFKLLEAGASIELATSEASRSGQIALVFKLLEAGASIELATSEASRSGQIALVFKLLDAGASIDLAVNQAVYSGEVLLVQELLYEGDGANLDSAFKVAINSKFIPRGYDKYFRSFILPKKHSFIYHYKLAVICWFLQNEHYSVLQQYSTYNKLDDFLLNKWNVSINHILYGAIFYDYMELFQKILSLYDYEFVLETISLIVSAAAITERSDIIEELLSLSLLNTVGLQLLTLGAACGAGHFDLAQWFLEKINDGKIDEEEIRRAIRTSLRVYFNVDEKEYILKCKHNLDDKQMEQYSYEIDGYLNSLVNYFVTNDKTSFDDFNQNLKMPKEILVEILGESPFKNKFQGVIKSNLFSSFFHDSVERKYYGRKSESFEEKWAPDLG